MAGARPPRWLVQGLNYLAGVAVTALFAVLVVRHVNFDAVWRTMRGANLLWLPPVAATFLLSYWLQAVRWHHLVRHLKPVAVGDAFPRVLLAHSAGMLLPFQLGQVLMVQVSAEKFGLDREQLFGAEFVSRLMDGIVFALFLLAGLIWLPIGSAFTALTVFMLVGTTLGFALAFWGSHAHPHVLEGSRLPFKRTIVRLHEQVLHPLLQGLSSVRNLGQMRDVFALSLAIWGVEAVFYAFTGWMLDLHAGPATYLFLVAAANIGGGIPFAQSGAGFVYVAREAFVALGQRVETATAYVLVLQALLILPIVVIAPYAILRLHLGWADVIPWLKSRKSGKPGKPKASEESQRFKDASPPSDAPNEPSTQAKEYSSPSRRRGQGRGGLDGR